MSALDNSFFSLDTVIAAQELLGCYLIHEIDGMQLIGMIVETKHIWELRILQVMRTEAKPLVMRLCLVLLGTAMCI